jgi:hypothetical protein
MAAKELFVIAVTFTRFSLLLFYYRLVSDTGLRHFRKLLHLAMAFNMAILLSFTGLTIFSCVYVYSD